MNLQKVYVNIAPTLLYGGNTGIQRVVRELERFLDGREIEGILYEFGGLIGGRWIKANTFRSTINSAQPNHTWLRQKLRSSLPARIRTKLRHLLATLKGRRFKKAALPPGSTILEIDAGWIDDWRSNLAIDAKRITLVYDLIPQSHPEFCTPEHNQNFMHWLDHIITRTDAVISISNSAAEACKEYSSRIQGNRIKEFGYFHLGCDFNASKVAECHKLPDELRAQGFFLMVGSIEPRKNHRLALDAFSSFRSEGGTWDLVIVGRRGWKCDEIVSAITQSHNYKKSLHWFDDADDALLTTIYRNAGALIFPSHIEGFGLPLIEAAHWGCPVLASDIPVFREIGENFTNFFNPSSASELQKLMHDAEHNRLAVEANSNDAIGLSWQDAAYGFAKEISRLRQEANII